VQRFFGSRALAIVVVSLVALVGGALLAYWQWTRYQSATGTLQNLGYVLQWPLFGVFPGFMFWRIHRTAQRERAYDEATREPVQEQQARPRPEPTLDPRLTYVQNRTVNYVAGEDEELLAYNRHLAELADREQRHAG
jgi:DNA-binding transcriptional regulator of glucitol operon